MREIHLWLKLMQEAVDADPTFDTEDVNTHQLLSYSLTFQKEIECLGENATPGELQNIIGHHATALRHLQEKHPELVQPAKPTLDFRPQYNYALK